MEGSKKECPRLKKTKKTGPDTVDPRSKGISSPWEEKPLRLLLRLLSERLRAVSRSHFTLRPGQGNRFLNRDKVINSWCYILCVSQIVLLPGTSGLHTWIRPCWLLTAALALLSAFLYASVGQRPRSSYTVIKSPLYMSVLTQTDNPSFSPQSFKWSADDTRIFFSQESKILGQCSQQGKNFDHWRFIKTL